MVLCVPWVIGYLGSRLTYLIIRSTHPVEIVSYQEMKHPIGPPAKLDCFFTQENLIVFTFSQAQTVQGVG